jgi:hypothetical protein
MPWIQPLRETLQRLPFPTFGSTVHCSTRYQIVDWSDLTINYLTLASASSYSFPAIVNYYYYDGSSTEAARYMSTFGTDYG